jgi:hypothetical protein
LYTACRVPRSCTVDYRSVIDGAHSTLDFCPISASARGPQTFTMSARRTCCRREFECHRDFCTHYRAAHPDSYRQYGYPGEVGPSKASAQAQAPTFPDDCGSAHKRHRAAEGTSWTARVDRDRPFPLSQVASSRSGPFDGRASGQSQPCLGWRGAPRGAPLGAQAMFRRQEKQLAVHPSSGPRGLALDDRDVCNWAMQQMSQQERTGMLMGARLMAPGLSSITQGSLDRRSRDLVAQYGCSFRCIGVPIKSSNPILANLPPVELYVRSIQNVVSAGLQHPDLTAADVAFLPVTSPNGLVHGFRDATFFRHAVAVRPFQQHACWLFRRMRPV